MGQITKFPFVRYYRGEPSTHVMRFRAGRPVASGTGLSFWFAALDTAIAELPLDDRDLPFLFHGTSADFQDVTAQGVITYRVVDPLVLSSRVDFGVDVATGRYRKTPTEQLAALLTQLTQQIAFGWIAVRPLAEALAEGTAPLRDVLAAGLADETSLSHMGLEIVTVRVSAVSPNAEMEKALQTPAREHIKQEADEAVFERRAVAVEKERAIAENELANRIELTRREQALVEREGANERLRATEQSEAERIRAVAEVGREQLRAQAEFEMAQLRAESEAASISLVEGARAAVEGAMMDVYRDVPREVLMGLAMREFAGKLEKIEHLSITPELLTPLLGGLVQAATKRMEL